MASWNAGGNKCHQPCLGNGSRVLMLGVWRGESLSLENSHSCKKSKLKREEFFFVLCGRAGGCAGVILLNYFYLT